MHEPCDKIHEKDVVVVIDVTDEGIVLRDESNNAKEEFGCHSGKRVIWKGTENVKRWVVGMCGPEASPFGNRRLFSEQGTNCDAGKITGKKDSKYAFWVFAQTLENEALFRDPKLVIQTGPESLRSEDALAYAETLKKMTEEAESLIELTEQVRAQTLVLAEQLSELRRSEEIASSE